MTSAPSIPHPKSHSASPLPAREPASSQSQALLSITRGGGSEIPFLIFSGSTSALNELPAEPTALALRKFALPDPTLPASLDFARSPANPLPLWPDSALQPHPSLCFIFTSPSHPAIIRLRAAGAIENQHFLIFNHFNLESLSPTLLALDTLLPQIPASAPILILGFGDQGQRITRHLLTHHCRLPQSLIILDHNLDSTQIASSLNLTLINPQHELPSAALVIYSPLMVHENLRAHFRCAQSAKTLTFDNTSRPAPSSFLLNHHPIYFDPPASTLLENTNWQVALNLPPESQPLLPPITAHIIRHDSRLLLRHTIPHLHSGHTLSHESLLTSSDLSQPSAHDPLAPATFAQSISVYISLTDRPHLPAFAARHFASQLWPASTQSIFPSAHPADMGATSFERILRRHLDRAEISMASQSTIQQVLLGILAHHYASASPIIEIGSALGGSGLLMAIASHSAHAHEFISIDPGTATRDVMRFIFARENLSSRLHQLVTTSNAAAPQLAHLKNSAGLVFIDGLHTYQAMLDDFNNYAPLLRPGGALLIHDVDPARLSVFQVVLDHILPDPRFKPLALVDGLLILEKIN